MPISTRHVAGSAAAVTVLSFLGFKTFGVPEQISNTGLRLFSGLIEAGYVPDFVLRMGIRALCQQRLNSLPNPKNSHPSEVLEYTMKFVDRLRSLPIAVDTTAANEQHYEVPPEYYEYVLGPRRKYSCCNYPNLNTSSLAQAEDEAFRLVCDRANITEKNQSSLSVLDLGCGWGSLTLYLLERFPDLKVTCLSNSMSQGQHIRREAERRGGAQWTSRLSVNTQDANDLKLDDDIFDRICSIEMFEHMKNYGLLFKRLGRTLKPNGIVFVHIFVHKTSPYHFEVPDDELANREGGQKEQQHTETKRIFNDGKQNTHCVESKRDQKVDGNWMARHFFTGGTMPSADLLHYFCGQGGLNLERQWTVDGGHYGQTSEHWLQNQDKNWKDVERILEKAYKGSGVSTRVWVVRWRLFYLAVAELFKFNDGKEWYVCHYRFRKTAENVCA